MGYVKESIRFINVSPCIKRNAIPLFSLSNENRPSDYGVVIKKYRLRNNAVTIVRSTNYKILDRSGHNVKSHPVIYRPFLREMSYCAICIMYIALKSKLYSR